MEVEDDVPHVETDDTFFFNKPMKTQLIDKQDKPISAGKVIRLRKRKKIVFF